MALLPQALALVLCDAVWKDPGSGKHFLLGTFSNVNSRKYPARHGHMAVYGVLTDGQGKIPLRLTVVGLRTDAPEEEVLAQAEIEVEFTDQRATVEAVFVLQGLLLPRPGEYRIRLEAAGSCILERRFTAKMLEQP